MNNRYREGQVLAKVCGPSRLGSELISDPNAPVGYIACTVLSMGGKQITVAVAVGRKLLNRLGRRLKMDLDHVVSIACSLGMADEPTTLTGRGLCALIAFGARRRLGSRLTRSLRTDAVLTPASVITLIFGLLISLVNVLATVLVVTLVNGSSQSLPMLSPLLLSLPWLILLSLPCSCSCCPSCRRYHQRQPLGEGRSCSTAREMVLADCVSAAASSCVILAFVAYAKTRGSARALRARQRVARHATSRLLLPMP